MAADLNVQNHTIGTHAYTTNQSQASSQASGKLMGFNVKQVNDPMSLLAQSAEELTFSVDTTDEFELSERKEKNSIELKNSPLVQRYQEVQKHFDLTNKVKDFKTAIEALKSMHNSQTLMQLAKDLSENSAEAFVLLQEVYKDLKSNNASFSLLKDIENAIDELEAKEKGKIVTAMQVEITKAEDARFANISGGIDLYAKSVSEFKSPLEVYTYIHDKYQNDIELALDFLYKLLGNDLACEISSMEKTQLESISGSLGELRAFQSAHALCDTMATRLEDIHSIKSLHDGFSLLGKILNLKKEVYLSSSNIDSVMNEYKLSNPQEEVMFLQELFACVKKFSSTLFDADQERNKLIDAVQTSLDRAVEKEDEWLMSME